MSFLSLPRPAARAEAARSMSTGVARGIILAAVLLGTFSGIADGGTTTTTDTDLVGLLRFMAVLKAALALAFVGAIWWRLASPIGTWRLAAYATTSAAMSAGPVLIWTMSHLGLGAALLHAGLLAAALLLWRDPACATQLSALVASRRR